MADNDQKEITAAQIIKDLIIAGKLQNSHPTAKLLDEWLNAQLAPKS